MMQMSQDAVFCFTEGYTDRYVYDRLAGGVCRKRNLSVTIVTADEIPGGGGGKVALLKFFDYARRTALLTDTFKGKNTLCIFFLDKDLDDLRRRKRRSRHVMYTDSYELENVLYLNGDLPSAAAAASQLHLGVFGRRFVNSQAWCAQAAAHWREWVTLCVFSILRAPIARGFYGRSHSQINQPTYAAVNQIAFRNEVLLFEQDWNNSNTTFDKAFAAVERLVQRAYDDGEADRIFRGKWYGQFLYADVLRLAGNRQWNRNGFHERVLSCLAMTLNRNSAWARSVCARTEELLRQM